MINIRLFLDALSWLIAIEVHCDVEVVIILTELLPLIGVRYLMNDHLAREVCREINVYLDHVLQVSFNDVLVQASILVHVKHEI